MTLNRKLSVWLSSSDTLRPYCCILKLHEPVTLATNR